MATAGTLCGPAAESMVDPFEMSTGDTDLIARVAGGDEGAMAALYDRFAPVAMALAVRVLGNRAEAEDVIQTVFIRLWKDAAHYDASRGSPASWLLASVRNSSIDRVRRRRAYAEATQRAAAQPVPAAPDPAPGEERRRVVEAIAGLPADQREAIEMAYFEGLSQSEIAAKLGHPLGTVKTRMRLGMMKLKQALGGAGRDAS